MAARQTMKQRNVFRKKGAMAQASAWLLAIAAFVVFAGSSQAQTGREFIRSQIEIQGTCRNVAITMTGGDLMLYGHNGCARQDLPQSLDDAIVALNDEGEYIDDIQLTEKGRWLILYGDNGFQWNDIPEELERQIRAFNDHNEVVLSASFNDDGDWCVISTEHYVCSDPNVQAWLEAGIEAYGKLLTTCITDDGMVAVFKEGYRLAGKVPANLEQALKDTPMDVYRLKIAGESWFIADKEGHYQYDM